MKLSDFLVPVDTYTSSYIDGSLNHLNIIKFNESSIGTGFNWNAGKLDVSIQSGGGGGTVQWASGTVGSNNQVITSAGDGSIVSESNLIFDGVILQSPSLYVEGKTYLGISYPVTAAERVLNIGGSGVYIEGNLQFSQGRSVYMGTTSDIGPRFNWKQVESGGDAGAYLDYYPKMTFRTGDINSGITTLVCTSLGNVAVGTTDTGGRKFYVSGTATISQGLLVNDVILADRSNFGFYTSKNNNHLTQNAYYDGAWKSYGADSVYGGAVVFQTSNGAGGATGAALKILVDNNISAANEALSFTTLFTVKPNGYTGILTDDPAYSLDVSGNGVIFRRAGQFLFFNPNYGLANQYGQIQGQMGLSFATGGDNTRMACSSLGHVGIGSNATNFITRESSSGTQYNIFTIIDASQTSSTFGFGLFTVPRLVFGGYNSGGNRINTAEIFVENVSLTEGAESGKMHLRTKSTGGPQTTAITIDPSQMVGFGTSSPISKFELSASGTGYWNNSNDWTAQSPPLSTVTISNTTNGGYDSALLFRQTDSAAVTKNAGAIGMVGTGGWTSGDIPTQKSDMYFAVRNTIGGITERMRISSGGNFYVKTLPSSTASNIVYYNPTTGEMTYGAPGTVDISTLNIDAYVNSSSYYDGSLMYRVYPNPSTGLGSIDSQGLYAMFTAGESIQAGYCGYVTPGGYIGLLDADASNKMPGICIYATSGGGIGTGQTGRFLIYGPIRYTSYNFVTGKQVYAGLDGFPTTTIPTGVNDCVQVIGVATSNDSFIFNPSPDFMVLK